MFGSNSIATPIDLDKPGTYSKDSLRAITDELMRLPIGTRIPSGNFTIKSFFGFFRADFNLKHDIYHQGEIDLERDIKTRADVIKLLLQERYVNKRFIAGDHYYIQHNHQFHHIFLTTDALVRKDKYGNIVCDVINKKNCLGSGSFAEFLSVSGTLKYRYHKTKKLKFENNDEKRGVKDGNERFDFGDAYKKTVRHEFDIMQHCPHLSTRYLVFSTTTTGKILSLICMRKLHGKELFSVINDDMQQLTLTIEDRFQLALEILKKLKLQVHDNNVIHRDVKPDNILVSCADGYWDANFIDFNLSQYQNVDDHMNCGTPFYAACEAYDGKIVPGSDVFSIALIIALLFRDKIQRGLVAYADGDKEISKVLSYRMNESWKISFDLFDGIPELSDECKKKIKALLIAMTQKDPQRRPKLHDCIQRLESIYWQYRMDLVPPAYQDNVKYAVSWAQATRDDLSVLSKNKITSDYVLNTLSDSLARRINALTDDKYSLREYTNTLGLKCLRSILDKQQLINQVNDVVQHFIEAENNTKFLIADLTDLYNKAIKLNPSSFTHAQQQILDDLKVQLAQHQLFVDNITNQPLQLDHIVTLTDHILKKNGKIERAMVYFDKLRPVIKRSVDELEQRACRVQILIKPTTQPSKSELGL